ncbi:MAG TPA: methyltransferase domain-containing protein [Polyangiaceae bacterium]|nr:methyltransferase domain-containing protein [Polyangiaceae bacterium]
MSLAFEYARQRTFRSWSALLDLLPELRGRTVLDLGSGIGDPASDLSARGARVIGIDGDPQLVEVARARGIANAEFIHGDLHRLELEPSLRVQGIWSSFTAAYFPALPSLLARFAPHLEVEGFVALVDIDDLFGHEPLPADVRAIFDAFAERALAEGRYDFYAGRKLEGHLREAGLAVRHVSTHDDLELSFSGPARADVLEAWRLRLERMRRLQEFAGARFAALRDAFLECLASPDHSSRARVYFCIAIKE